MNVSPLLIKALHKVKLLKYFNLSTTTSIDEKKYTIPLLGKSGYSHLVYDERWMFKVLKKLQPWLAERGALVDVGMNVGQTMLTFKTCYPDRTYFGFEPNPICNFYLERLVIANKLQSVHLFPVGLSDHEGILQLLFFTNDSTDQTASLVDRFREYEVLHKSQVFVTRADRLAVWNEMPPALIKIDVEGGELEVLKGFFDIVNQHRPFIICEVLPAYTESNTLRINRQNELEKLLSRMNYGIARITNSGNFTFLDSIGITNDVSLSNYFFYPLERKSLLSSE